jgi:hypothetical protein
MEFLSGLQPFEGEGAGRISADGKLRKAGGIHSTKKPTEAGGYD